MLKVNFYAGIDQFDQFRVALKERNSWLEYSNANHSINLK